MALLSEQKQTANVSYLSKDFDSIKSDLIDFIKRNHPEDWSDFNEASGGMAMLEMVAYVGDMLSFYIDRQVNESFINRAVEEKNILANAAELGYKSRLKTPAVVNLNLSASLVNAISSDSMFIIRKGSRVKANFNSNITFEILEDVDFSETANRTATVSNDIVNVTKSGVSAIAGTQKTFGITVGDAKKFLKITLPDADITEIISVTSSDGYAWNEVDYLAQETVFIGDRNTTSTSGDTPFVMKMKRVPRRFITERETGRRTSVTFGAGISSQEDSEFVPNPEDYVQPPTLRGSPSGFFPSIVDSSNFLNTKTLGVAPRNVRIDITYRMGGGVDTNVGSRTLNSFSNLVVDFKSQGILSSASSEIRNAVTNSLTVNNPAPAGGGSNAETFNEIRNNAAAYFGSQGRCVTLQDYQVRVMTMPNKFGSVFRAYSRKDSQNHLGVELILTSLDSNGYLTNTNSVLKNNVETYMKKFKSFSDTIRITDGKIVNLGINFSIVPDPNSNVNEALLAAMFLLRKRFNVKNTNFGDYLVKSELTSNLMSLDQIIAVPNFEFTNLYGTIGGRSYSNNLFDIKSNTRKGILYFPQDTIYQIKYLDWDLTGNTE